MTLTHVAVVCTTRRGCAPPYRYKCETEKTTVQVVTLKLLNILSSDHNKPTRDHVRAKQEIGIAQC